MRNAARLADNVGTAVVVGGAATQLPGINKSWTQEAIDGKELEDAIDPDTGTTDVSSLKELGWKQFIPGLAPSDEQILSALQKQEQVNCNT